VLQLLRKALPRALSPEKSEGVAGLSLELPRALGEGGDEAGGCTEGILDEWGGSEGEESDWR
jgi:hypothetical protein